MNPCFHRLHSELRKNEQLDSEHRASRQLSNQELRSSVFWHNPAVKHSIRSLLLSPAGQSHYCTLLCNSVQSLLLRSSYIRVRNKIVDKVICPLITTNQYIHFSWIFGYSYMGKEEFSFLNLLMESLLVREKNWLQENWWHIPVMPT